MSRGIFTRQVHVDFDTQKRTVKDSAKIFQVLSKEGPCSLQLIPFNDPSGLKENRLIIRLIIRLIVYKYSII